MNNLDNLYCAAQPTGRLVILGLIADLTGPRGEALARAARNELFFRGTQGIPVPLPPAEPAA